MEKLGLTSLSLFDFERMLKEKSGEDIQIGISSILQNGNSIFKYKEEKYKISFSENAYCSIIANPESKEGLNEIKDVLQLAVGIPPFCKFTGIWGTGKEETIIEWVAYPNKQYAQEKIDIFNYSQTLKGPNTFRFNSLQFYSPELFELGITLKR